MIAAADLCAKFQQALDEKWGYIFGRSGVLWTKAAQDKLEAAYQADPDGKSDYKNSAKYGSRWIGRRVADCSGLFVWAMKQLGGSIYHGSNTIFNKYCTSKGKITSGISLRPGTAVFLVRDGNRHHIGLYVGNDTVIEAKGSAYGVVTSTLDHWDEWGELGMVVYDGPAPTASLFQGCRGDEVIRLQELLMSRGYDCGCRNGVADGVFGTKTHNAVKSFQAANGLTADGIVGSKTLEALGAKSEPQESGISSQLFESIEQALTQIEAQVQAVRAVTAAMKKG